MGILERLGLGELKEKSRRVTDGREKGKMKRDGHVIEEIVDRDNLETSFDTVVHGTLRKSLPEGKWLLAHRDEFLDGVAAEILGGSVNCSNFHPKDILEGKKMRHIQVFDMKTRIKVNAVMSVVDRHLRRRFIRTTSASIKQRGMHELKAYIERDIRTDPDGMRYLYKFDIKKFYETVQQDFVMYCIRKVFKDERLISILEGFVRLLPEGLSMGLRSSQGLANLLLSVFLDHYLKDKYGVKHFYRYCDDGVAGSGYKLYLWSCRDVVHVHVECIGQTIKLNERVFPLELGLDFLGYVIYPTHSLLRKSVKQKFARKLKKVKSRKRRVELVGSLWGMAKHANCWHLLEKLLFHSEFNKLKRKKMKDFGKSRCSQSQLIDGKKSFRGQKVSGKELNGKAFIVLDYETDVVSREDREKYDGLVADAIRNGTDQEKVPKPKKKYLVNVVFQGELRKFWTADKDIWKELDERKKSGELPFFCALDADFSGNYPRFMFVSATAKGFPMPTDEEIERLNVKLNINIPL